MCFSMFVSATRWLAEIWQLSRRGVGEPQGNWRWNWRWNSNSRGVVASSRPFPAPPPERPGELGHRLHVVRSTQQSLATRTCCLERSLPNIVTVSALSHSTRVKSVEPLSHETGSTGISSFFKTLYQQDFSVPTNTWTLIKPLGIRGWHATRKIWTFLKLIHMSVEVNTWLVGSEVWVF